MHSIEVYAGKGVVSEELARVGFSTTTVDIIGTPTHRIDARKYQPHAADFVWASPPCSQFAACSMPWHPSFGETPSLEHVENAIRIIRESGAAYWVIENVRGSIPHISPLLGEPQRLGSIFLWHNLPRPIASGLWYGKTRTTGEQPGRRAETPRLLATAVARAAAEALAPRLWEANA